MPVNPALYRIISQHFLDLPHSRAIGLRYEGIRARRPVLSFDWQPHLVGRHDTQIIHGGTIITLVDMVSACAVTAQLPSAEILSTLDMRIDYMHPATPGRRIYGRAECYRLAGQVAFVRSSCYQEDPSDPFALGMATFMRTPLSPAEQAKLQELLQA
ncbi:thioesterase [Eikenella corrodens]|uniref:Thioesterase n=1 Tax=Eikenella corrodens TaxID=539 RepID=A0A1A9RRX8_EIKCO|nr:PaaI family thioesterase [Eikenella corrodens]OAM23245.1 thioesterase [Eikenella corrodens]